MHFQIAQWEAAYQATIFTKNDDDLLERGGCRNVHHHRGSLTEMHCTECDNRWSVGHAEWTSASRCPNKGCDNPKKVKPNAGFLDCAPPIKGRPPVQEAWFCNLETLFHQILEDLRSEDVLLVMGAQHSLTELAERAKCTRVLHRLEEGGDLHDREELLKIDTKNFDHVFYGPANEAIPKIDAVLTEVLGPRLTK